MSTLRRLAALLAWAAVFLSLRPALALPETPIARAPQNGVLLLAPRGGGLDDSARVQAAAEYAASRGVSLRTAGAFTTTAAIDLSAASGLVWDQTGSTWSATIAGSGSTAAAVLALANTGASLTLASDAVVDTKTIVVTTAPGWLIPGAQIQVGILNAGQIFTVQSVSGSAPSVTVTLDRVIKFSSFTTANSATVLQITRRPHDITIIGGGAVWSVQAARGWELAQGERLHVQGPLTIQAQGTGIADVGYSDDVEGHSNRLVGPILIDGKSLSSGTGIGLFWENQEGSFTVGPITLRGWKDCAYAYSARDVSFSGLTAEACVNHNLVLDEAGALPFAPSRGGIVRDFHFRGSSQIGILVADGSSWTLADGEVEGAVSHGIDLEEVTSGAGAPADVTIRGVTVRSCGSIAGGTWGIQATKASGLRVIGSRFISNQNGALNLASAVTGAIVSDCEFASNGTAVATAADVRIANTRFTDNAVGVLNSGSSVVRASGVDMSWPSAAPANYQGFYVQSTGGLWLTSSTITLRSASIFLGGIVTTAGVARVSSTWISGHGYAAYVNGGGSYKVDALSDFSGADVPFGGGSTQSTASGSLTTYQGAIPVQALIAAAALLARLRRRRAENDNAARKAA